MRSEQLLKLIYLFKIFDCIADLQGSEHSINHRVLFYITNLASIYDNNARKACCLPLVSDAVRFNW